MPRQPGEDGQQIHNDVVTPRPPQEDFIRQSLTASLPPALKSKSTSTLLKSRSPAGSSPTTEQASRRASIEQETPDALLDPGDHHLPASRPPPLNYTLTDKKLRIFIFWCFILFDCAIVPTALYFVLWYEAGPGSQPRGPLAADTVLSIVTATIGGTAIIEWLVRCWKLWKKDSDCRVIGARNRWYFDWYQWWFGLCMLIVVAELILGTAWRQPKRRLLALPLSSVQIIFGSALLFVDILHWCSAPAPLRISSVARDAPAPPGIYPLIEDICAVSGGGKTVYREALARRYAASPLFRAMLRRLGLFWALGALACAGGTAYLVLEFPDIDIAYAFGWTVPFVWVGVWSVVTIPYVKIMLAREQRLWVGEGAPLSAVAPSLEQV
ncbi:uncharacterized protein B0I36DRAFT_268844 [Microdochium trichocladiopsis]|uniref:Uncharacterized protein n=1 Tax=Microdochium trichocladiopsis TaxID=1682393 RepID=A0A9P8Y620_9PEZI|nr:uncharacterized protein B0I36DRAFT_268844 [Microdochium trichocladiopsis]KAH7028747.1 hypothetical protein B0I36DRAFT_268844 [Microdochium trichocladiopsis]